MPNGLYRLLLQTASVGGGSGTAPYEDNFDSGSSIDTSGARYVGANPWTLLNATGATNSVAGGVLTLTGPHVSLMSPVLAVQPLSAGNGAWRTQQTADPVNDNYRGVGIVLRESSTGKQLCFGFGSDGVKRAEVRRMTSFTNWTANYGSTSVGTLASYFEVERSGTTWSYRYSSDGSSWTTLTSAAESADFTSAPDQIGLWSNGSETVGGTTAAVFERFWKV